MSAARDWGGEVRALLARVLERPSRLLDLLPDDTPLFGAVLNLDSFTGMTLLAAITHDYGVDLAEEDLALDSLETIGTLTAFLAAHAEVRSRE